MKIIKNITIYLLSSYFLLGCCAKERTRISCDCSTPKTEKRTVTSRIYMMYHGDIGISDNFYNSSYITPKSPICNQKYFKELLKNKTIDKDSVVKILCNATTLCTGNEWNDVYSFLEVIRIIDK